MTHASSASGATTLSLQSPIILANLGSWIPATCALSLLDVITAFAATRAQRVCVLVASAECGSSVTHDSYSTWSQINISQDEPT